MKKFLLKSILLVFSTIIVVDALLLQVKNDWSLHSHEKNVLFAYNKLSALKDSTKIVIIAGSNGGFGINSRMISQEFHLPVVNTSTHGGLGVRLQFELYKEFLHENDIVILCPEYGGEKSRLYGDAAAVRILKTHVPSAFMKVSVPQWVFLHKYIGVSYIETLGHRGDKEIEGPYSVKSLNEFGDIDCERQHKDNIRPQNIIGQTDDALLKYYKYIRTYTKERCIKLVFLPPTLMESNFARNSAQIDSLVTTLKQSDIPYQASPGRYSFPDSLYYDTPYHMTQYGAIKRTERLIEDLHYILQYE